MLGQQVLLQTCELGINLSVGFGDKLLMAVCDLIAHGSVTADVVRDAPCPVLVTGLSQ